MTTCPGMAIADMGKRLRDVVERERPVDAAAA
jgi:hypothetical protein